MVELGGDPLIYWTIRAGLDSLIIDDLYVSSEDDEIINYSSNLGTKVLKRPPELAKDETLTIDVIFDAITQLNLLEDDYIILLQPTSPFRNSIHIDSAFNYMASHSSDGCISVKRIDASLLKSFTLFDGYLRGTVNDEYPFMRRQDLPDTFSANGAIYIFKVLNVINDKTLLSPRTVPYIMEDSSSLDIDTPEDLFLARKILENQMGASRK